LTALSKLAQNESFDRGSRFWRVGGCLSPERSRAIRVLFAVAGVVSALSPSWAASARSKKARKAPVVANAVLAHRASPQGTSSSSAVRVTTAKVPGASPAPAKKAPAKSTGPWRVPNYSDSTAGDYIEGDDLTARKAALDGLGRLNGSVVISDADTGRVLTVVNQKVAFHSGYQPCSTVKIPVALAALTESLIDRNTLLRVYGRTKFAMTEALARSNNQYFASLGEKLGFARMSYYARLFGLGEKAGLDIVGEQPGILPPETPKSGMGMMTSFGDGIYLTPLELSALIGAVANGGTLYYLQYPRNDFEAGSLIPRVKRRLDIDQVIPEMLPGMEGAVNFGTARRIGPDHPQPIYGKTGTCTDSRSPTHLGWFGSFSQVGKEKLVVTVLLTGGNLVSGPAAAGVAGEIFKGLNAAAYARRTQPGGSTIAAGN
jgi:penicillin-binding protein 2